jgi:heavy metal translocating P-type ATPase
MLGRLGLAIFLTLNVLVFSMALWTPDVYEIDLAAGSALDRPLADVFRYLSLLLTLPVVWMLGLPLAESTWQQLRRGRATTDLLLLSGVAAATAYSAVSVFRGQGHVYFEVACVVLVAVTLGRWLESTGKAEANRELDALEKLIPTTVVVVRAGGDQVLPAASVVSGDVLRVIAGERLPVDGRILSGMAAIDEQLVTGESQGVVKQAGDPVFGGTTNLDGQLVVRAAGPVQAGTLGRMLSAVRQARLAKGYYEQLADRVAAIFLPLVMVVALATFAWQSHGEGLEQGILGAMAVVLVACPCALGLATPLATWCALTTASQHQVLFRHGVALEHLARAHSVFFDKTGTLTTGEPKVIEFACGDPSESADILHIAARLAASSGHPLCRAIDDFAAVPDVERCTDFCQVRTLPGLGVRGVDRDGRTVTLGNLRLMESDGLVCPPALESARTRLIARGMTLCAIGWDGQVRSLFGFSEQIRAEAPSAIEELRSLGLNLAVLTGDHQSRAAALADQLRLPVHGDLLPDEKVAVVQQSRRQRRGVVMVGDGLNDAPALAAADVGVALGCGADLSRESADVCLLSNDLGRVAWAIVLARRTVRVVRQNLFWALVYNTLGIGLAVSGWLNPIWASAAMVASSLLVIGNSLRLKQIPRRTADERSQNASPRSELSACEPPGTPVATASEDASQPELAEVVPR